MKLATLARRAAKSRNAIAVRGGGGGPLARPEPPKQPLPEQDELIWDDGTANPENALDQFNLVTSNQALAWFLGGMGFFGVVGLGAKLSNVEARTPFAPKQVLVPPEVRVGLGSSAQ